MSIMQKNEAKEKEVPINIIGDYDCDGVYATAILYNGLKQFGIIASTRLPRRFSALVRTYKNSFEGTDMTSDNMPEKYSQIDYEYLEKSIEFCQKQGMEVLLLRPPERKGRRKAGI